jgi:ATP-binding cassette subfamily G (WHITE) protein 2 (SNQ2)
MAEIPALFTQRAVVLRHRDWALYHPFIDQAALFFVDIPISFTSLAVFSVVLYEMCQLQQSAGQFLCVFSFRLDEGC